MDRVLPLQSGTGHPCSVQVGSATGGGGGPEEKRCLFWEKEGSSQDTADQAACGEFRGKGSFLTKDPLDILPPSLELFILDGSGTLEGQAAIGSQGFSKRVPPPTSGKWQAGPRLCFRVWMSHPTASPYTVALTAQKFGIRTLSTDKMKTLANVS
ncbi:hypothetical protein MG293_020533 [Ovis ammon polii]|uniref:Uncharacterized protein n=1 Tax=Ovis ammon polii TaxID=230172 RepID=A0AAD4XX59_OVIAM|nr:hypothetical protein MG293_020533 [Ovis ammon polii]KAI4550152.1 hypothetical protein MJT46_018878 [Ovis ammon polii x Ovis aries]